MYIEYLLTYIQTICFSYLTKNEIIYISGEWDKYQKDIVCIIAVENGWLDLLIWAHENGYFGLKNKWYDAIGDSLYYWSQIGGCELNNIIFVYASQHNHQEILNWLAEKGCICNKNCYMPGTI